MIYSKKADFKAVAEQFNISPVLARILRNRDLITYEQIDNFLNVSEKVLHDPFLLKGMGKATEVLKRYSGSEKTVRIIGDYDCDGVFSSFILKSLFDLLKIRNDVRLPDRVADGYGMSPEMAKEAAEDGISLIITCDNGISCVEACKEAKLHGIDVIVTDHHAVSGKLPDALAIIDAKQEDDEYPFKEICGAGVAFKLAEAMLHDYPDRTRAREFLKEMIIYAGFATITDIVSLKDENRFFAKEALKYLPDTQNPGLRALLELKGLYGSPVTSFHVGFILGPCINSAGRLENAMTAFDLLAEKDPSKALLLAKRLSDLNDQRKKLTADQYEAAVKLAGIDPPGKILAYYLPDAHESIAGIIAGRLKEEYNRPAFVITDSSEGLKGSGRSPETYNMIENLAKHSELFKKFGGHNRACGFTLKSGVEEFRKTLEDSCALNEEDLEKKVWIDMQLPLEFISFDLACELEKLEPFGTDNEKPLFAEKDLKVVKCAVIGKNRSALKMLLENNNGTRMDAVCFRAGGQADALNERLLEKSGSRVRITYYPSVNEWRGVKSLQLIIQDIELQPSF